MRNELLVIPYMRVGMSPDGRFVLTRKFIEGMNEYCRYWPGKVTVLIRQSQDMDDSLDHVAVRPADLPFGIEIWGQTRSELLSRFAKASMVLATLTKEHLHLGADCRSTGTRLVWVTETSLRTRKQIIDAMHLSSLRRAKRKFGETIIERRFRSSIALADGVQCNGTPVFNAYSKLNKRPLLFFDSRISRSMLADADTLQLKTHRMLKGDPLRLAFSGRLVSIKGVDYLPTVASELRRLGVSFVMDIFGGGDREQALRQAISHYGLEGHVRLGGVLQFETELVPVMKRDVDLFVCCHPQGDPSCTYLETLSCSTPITGFGNEAWAGLAELSGAGWIAPIGDAVALANNISKLDKDRSLLVEAAKKALEFSSRHSFEETMRSRVAHLLMCAEAS